MPILELPRHLWAPLQEYNTRPIPSLRSSGIPIAAMSQINSTSTEHKLFYIIITTMKNKPEVDWQVVAEQMGWKSIKVARTRYGQIMSKLSKGEAPASPLAVTSNSKKRKGRDPDDEEVTAKARKIGKGSKKGRLVVQDHVAQDEEIESVAMKTEADDDEYEA